MGKSKEVKTNAMRILERNKIPYKEYTYECDEFVDALKVADTLGQPYELLYKTLVTIGNSRNYFVFVIPIAEELDMKKAAKSVGEKSVSMIHVKDINQVTGYIRGGCTAIGMKKQYVTRIDESAQKLEKMIVSGGRLGVQIELKPEDLKKVFGLVKEYLAEDGVFIFDLNTVHKYRDLMGECTISENREESSFIWENYFYEDEMVNEYDLTLFIREESDLYRKYEELHYQKAYELEQVKELLLQAGMEFVAAYDAFTHDPVTAESEGLYIIARPMVI